MLVTLFMLSGLALLQQQIPSSKAAEPVNDAQANAVDISDSQLANFAQLAMQGIPQQYPNKPSNVMASAEDVLSPQAMHPVFFGSFDWHSAVHGHWMLVKILRTSPGHASASSIRRLLNEQLTADKLQQEARYFEVDSNKSFERMYGWAWALQLVAELQHWDDEDGRRWRENLRPLEAVIVARIRDYLPKLSFPIRTGVHRDTGFALAMELDYARTLGDVELEQLLVEKAKAFYQDDVDYPAHYEPSGHDFFSSGFNEADLMRRVLDREAFSEWLDRFLPQLRAGEMGSMMEPVEVPDVTDGHLIHLAGLNLSRAWTMTGIASALDPEDPRRRMLEAAIDEHAAAGLKYVNSGHYEGEHWLATFAVYHLTAKERILADR